MVDLITEQIGIWTAAQTQKNNSGRGRGKNSNGQSQHGIKKLRELILELAVRGKLVPQDPNDELARVLLEKIAKEKARLIKEGKIKNQKPLPKISEAEKPFDIPDSWEWTRLGDVTNYGISDKTAPGSVDADTWVLELEDVEKETSRLLQKVRFADRQFRSSKNFFCKGDVIYGKLRPYLDKVIIADEDGVCTTEMIPLRGYDNITPHYLRFVMKSPYFIWYANESTHGMNLPRMGTDKARLALFPMVSEAEQHRIVAKVDELMALCDQLEQQQTETNATHQTLQETLLATLTSAADQGEFAKAWQRIANHFDSLFTTEQSIDQFKQTILQLAAMGKLGPQDPNDEPASILLEKIAEEKARLIKKGKIKKQKPLSEITEDEKPFELPEGWKFVRLERLCKLITKGSSPKWQGVAYTDDPDDVLFVTSENVGSHVLKLDSKKYVEKKFNEVEPRSILEKGDFLMNIVGASIGRTAIYNIDDLANINQAVCLIRGFSQLLNSQYLLNFFNSEMCVSYMFDKQVDNARANLSMGNIAKFVIPFPPLAEQHRIVAKVEELMELCDALKNRLNDAQTAQVQLADAIVEQAVG